MNPFLLAAGAASLLSLPALALTVTELPMLPAPAGYTAAPSVAHINVAGDVVGNVVFTQKPCPRCPTNVIRRAFLVSGGVVSQVGPDGFSISMSNDGGDIVGNWLNPADAQNYPYLVHDGVLTPLSPAPGSVWDIDNAGNVSYGARINEHGVSAALLSDLEHATHVFKYAAGISFNDLTCPSASDGFECVTGGTTGYDFVADLNDGATPAEAMAVGGDRDNPWYSSYGMQHAFVGWRGTTTNLSAGFTAAALSVNDFGTIAGYDDGAAVVWSMDVPGQWSEARLDSLVNDSTWTFTQASSVNNAGAVAGIGRHGGVVVPFLLTPGVVAGVEPHAGTLRFAAFPNPARGALAFSGSLPANAGGMATIAIVDVAGRRVAQLRTPVTGGRFHATWNSRGDGGGPLAAGVYFARLQAGPVSARATVIVAR